MSLFIFNDYIVIVSKSLLTVLGTLPECHPQTARTLPAGNPRAYFGRRGNSRNGCQIGVSSVHYGGMKKSAFFIPPVLIVSRVMPDDGYGCQALSVTSGATARPYALDNAQRGYAPAVFREASPRHAHASRAHVFALASLANCEPWQNCHSARCSSPARRARVNLRRESARDRMRSNGQGTKG
jgi:hypothetical protein